MAPRHCLLVPLSSHSSVDRCIRRPLLQQLLIFDQILRISPVRVIDLTILQLHLLQSFDTSPAPSVNDWNSWWQMSRGGSRCQSAPPCLPLVHQLSQFHRVLPSSAPFHVFVEILRFTEIRPIYNDLSS